LAELIICLKLVIAIAQVSAFVIPAQVGNPELFEHPVDARLPRMTEIGTQNPDSGN
jgi:hypothetical protein